MNDIKFLHIRRPAIRVGSHGMSIERAGAYGGVTVAYRSIGDGGYQVGFGRCRNDERYNKKLGREAALSDLLRAKFLVLGHEESPLEQIAEMVYGGAMRKNLRPAVAVGSIT